MMPAMIKIDCRSLIHVLEFSVLGVAIFDQKTLKVSGLLAATIICHIDREDNSLASRDI
jgi:hypothetical protein